MAKNYLKESRTYQDLLNTAKKYNIAEYIPGQSFDVHKEKMSAEDYEKSQKLLEYYTAQQNLTNNYDFDTQNVENNKKQQLQENAISKEMTMRYLPEYLKLQGLGGLGVSESSIIEANNNFRNARNSINSDMEAQKAELLRNYQENLGNLDTGATRETATIGEKYENARKEEASNLFNSFVNKIDYGEFNTSSELEESYDIIKNKLDETQRNIIEDKIKYLKNNIAQQELDNEYSEQIKIDKVAQELNTNKETELSNIGDYDVAKTPVFEDENDKTKYLENYEMHANGQIKDLGEKNKDEILKFVSENFGGDINTWTYGTAKNRYEYEPFRFGLTTTKLEDVDIEKLQKYAEKYGVEVEIQTLGFGNKKLQLVFDAKMNAQDMAKAIAAFSGKSFK